jgi:hypothetical protein
VELTWGMLFLLLVAAAGVAFWQDTLAARERANEAARETCTATGSSLLDGTVAFQSLRVVRGREGRPALERTYVFDYSPDGVTRLQGFVVVCSGRIESIGLEPGAHYRPPAAGE